MALDYTFPSTTDEAEGQLDSGIGASETSISVGTGEGDEFPIAVNGNATSAGTGVTLNATGIGATGIAIGDFIENITDGSHAYVLTVSANSITTTQLRGGTDDTWDNNDEYGSNPFVITLNSRNAAGDITASEQALIKARANGADIMTVATSGRGYNGSSAAAWDAADYVNLFVVSALPEAIRTALAEVLEDLDTKATQTYVDAALTARNWKLSCRVATDSALTLASDFENGDTVDGIVLATGDRILIKDQASADENGIYIVAASGAPTRATDFDADAEATSAFVPVEEGTANADTVWVCTDDEPEIGVDNINFVQFAATTTIASQAEAEAGAINTKVMTPLRTSQAIEALQNISDADATDLTDSGQTTLHSHPESFTVIAKASDAMVNDATLDVSTLGKVSYADANVQNALFQVRVPVGATSISAIKALALGGGAGDVSTSINVYNLAVSGGSEGSDTNGASVIDTLNGSTYVDIDFGSDSWNGLTIAENDILTIDLERDGGAGGDTLAAAMLVAAVVVTFA